MGLRGNVCEARGVLTSRGGGWERRHLQAEGGPEGWRPRQLPRPCLPASPHRAARRFLPPQLGPAEAPTRTPLPLPCLLFWSALPSSQKPSQLALTPPQVGPERSRPPPWTHCLGTWGYWEPRFGPMSDSSGPCP